MDELAIADERQDPYFYVEIENILGCLTNEEQEIFIAHIFWGMKLKELAKTKQVPYIRVKRSYKTIKEKVKKYFEEGGVLYE